MVSGYADVVPLVLRLDQLRMGILVIWKDGEWYMMSMAVPDHLFAS